MTANLTVGTISALLGNGDGTFQAPVETSATYGPLSVAVGDFNGDGTPDLAVTDNVIPGEISVFLGKGKGRFGAETDYNMGSSEAQSVAVGDFNGDGKPDLVVALGPGNAVSVLLGNGDVPSRTP